MHDRKHIRRVSSASGHLRGNPRVLSRDRVSRLHYYLQLRDNVVAYTQPISEEATFLLAAYALQADLGDFCEDQHQGHYFDPNLFFPPWVSSEEKRAFCWICLSE